MVIKSQKGERTWRRGVLPGVRHVGNVHGDGKCFIFCSWWWFHGCKYINMFAFLLYVGDTSVKKINLKIFPKQLSFWEPLQQEGEIPTVSPVLPLWFRLSLYETLEGERGFSNFLL